MISLLAQMPGDAEETMDRGKQQPRSFERLGESAIFQKTSVFHSIAFHASPPFLLISEALISCRGAHDFATPTENASPQSQDTIGSHSLSR
jgi:hypothetical protein